jgi:membrane associated rhomboid family serine protease
VHAPNNQPSVSFLKQNIYIYSLKPAAYMKQKIKHIFIPCLLLAAFFVILYTFLHWLLLIKLKLFEVDEDWIQFWIPFIAATMLSFIFIRPRLRILAKRKKGDFKTGFVMFAAFAIAAPAIPAQMYLESSTGKLSSLDRVHQLNPGATTEYYTLKHHFAARSQAGIYYGGHVSGRYNTDLDLDIYFATPIYDVEDGPAKIDIAGRPADTSVIIVDGLKTSREELYKISPDSVASVNVIKGKAAAALYGASVKSAVLVTLKHHNTPPPQMMGSPVGAPVSPEGEPKAWLCISYHKTIANHQSKAKKEEKEDAFFKKSINNFNSRNLDSFTYLKMIPKSSDRRSYRKAVENLKKYSSANSFVFLQPEFTPYSERNGSAFPWIFGWFAIMSLLLFLMLLVPKLNGEQLALPDLEQEPSKPLQNPVINFLKPKNGYYITPILVDANLVIFIAMVLSGAGFVTLNTPTLLAWGANYTPLTMNGQWWRLLTSMFLHGGLMHVLVNMYALVIVGVMLEPVLGKNRYLSVYLITGIIGSVASILTHKATVSVGASGAIFGMYGIFLALMLTNVFPRQVRSSFLSAIILMIVMTFVTGLGGGIDNSAHAGGLLSGIIIGFMLSPHLKREAEEKAQMISIETAAAKPIDQ